MGQLTQLLGTALSYSGRVALATLLELALVLGPPLVLAAVAQPVVLQSERWTERLAGRRARWLAVGWIATALHEAGHALFALLFGHRVRRVKWFDFDAEDGTLGQVEHDYDPTSLYQRAGRFFIGVGPVILGAMVVALGARLLLGTHASSGQLASHRWLPTLGETTPPLAAQLGESARDILHLVAGMSLVDWRSWVFAYVAYVGGGAMRLSGSDCRSFLAGTGTLGGLLLLANALTLWTGAAGTSLALRFARALALVDAALLGAIALQAVVAVVALALACGVAALRGRAAAFASG